MRPMALLELALLLLFKLSANFEQLSGWQADVLVVVLDLYAVCVAEARQEAIVGRSEYTLRLPRCVGLSRRSGVQTEPFEQRGWNEVH